MPTAERSPFLTFRDPSGNLSLAHDHAVRVIDRRYRSEVLDFLASPLRRRWEERGDLIATTVSEVAGADGELSLRHPLVFCPSYHWEWNTRQWLAAGDLTLRLCDEALAEGWILKDATPSNVLFRGTRPVFVDVPSFQRRDPESPVWLAYGQFVRTFILPLLANRWLGWPLAATILKRDGYEPENLYQALSRIRRAHPLLFWMVTLPTWLGRRDQAAIVKQARGARKEPEIATHLLRRSLDRLKRQLRQAAALEKPSRWCEYASHSPHYSAEDSGRKHDFVSEVLQRLRPATVLDVGANTGTYSFLAARHGARVVAVDTDLAALEQLTEQASERDAGILALSVNIARPTPGTGWENRETLSFLDRACGKFDLVMMLAVVHHILLSEQVPVPRIAELCSRLAAKSLLVEWVPPGDPMFRALLGGREGSYSAPTEDLLLEAFRPWFRTEERLTLPNGRILFLFGRT